MSGHTNGSGQTSIYRARWAAKSSSPSGFGLISASAPNTTSSCRARRTRRPSTWTRFNNDLQQRNVRERELPTFRPWAQRLVCLGGTQLSARDEVLTLRGRGAGLQDARTGRLSERKGRGAGRPLRIEGSAVGRGRSQRHCRPTQLYRGRVLDQAEERREPGPGDR